MAGKQELDVKAFGLTTGVIIGISTLVLGITNMITGWGTMMFDLIASIYIGYAATPTGILIGTFWALIDGTILGVLTAWIYNHLQGRI